MTSDSFLAPLAARVDRFFAGPGARWAASPGVVAFSGGADSTALAAVLARRGGVPVIAAHLDHGLDPGSAARAAAAAAAARRLGLPFVAERRPPAAGEHRAAGPEAAAHHRDDQAETVLLRLLFGSGWEGLAGIAPVAGLAPGVALLRPLLTVGRQEIEAALTRGRFEWLEDPTNLDPAVPRNRMRHLLLPALAHQEGASPEQISRRTSRVAAAAECARGVLAERLVRLLDLSSPPAAARGDAAGGETAPSTPLVAPSATPARRRERPAAAGDRPLASADPSLDLAALAALPAELLPPGLALLHRAAGGALPPPAAAVRELARQLAVRAAAARESRPVAVDAGRGWRWCEREGRLALVRSAGEPPAAGFSYTLAVPGELGIPEAGLAVRIGLEPPAPWMLRGSQRRAALDLPLVPGDRVVVRSRRPGDRLRPLGSAGTRRLKDLLIDHRVPREQRDRLPLLCLGRDGAEIAWVPGVTIDDRRRLGSTATSAPVWVAEIVAAEPGAGTAAGESAVRGNRW